MSFSSFVPVCRTIEMNQKDDPLSAAKSNATASKLALNIKDHKSLVGSARKDSPRDDGYTSQSEFSSTDAGESIEECFVDFGDLDDFASSCSDCEVSEDPSTVDSDNAAATCVYSVLMLLHLRAAVRKDETADQGLVHYSTRCESELPAKTCTKSKARTTSSLSAAAEDPWWRTSSDAATDSWRPALPQVAADSWLAQQRKRDATGAADSDDNMLRTARSILNKLTVEKFDALFQKLVTCGLKEPHHVALLMQEVFEKATTQHHFIPMYADLCVQLEKDPRIALIVEETDQMQNFRRLLLNQCQTTFEQLLGRRADEDDTDEEHVFRRKQEALGNIKLIGHLLVRGMLSPNLFTECCQELLENRTLCPEALESLAALMMVAGPKFDHCSWQYHAKLAKVLSDMALLTKDKLVAPRLRFLIRDVLDARDAGWPSSQVGIKTPATLEEVRNATVAPASPSGTGAIDCCLNALRAQVAIKAGKKKHAKFAEEAPVMSPKAQAPAPAVSTEPFTVLTFRRNLGSIFNDLASEKNIPAAVQRVRMEQVPLGFQADQYMDMITRVVEERRGAVRRCELAFLAGLGAADSSAFDKNECLAGIGLFFKDVYGDLCDEVHRLPAIMKSEFMPTVLTVFPEAELYKVVPTAMRK